MRTTKNTLSTLLLCLAAGVAGAAPAGATTAIGAATASGASLSAPAFGDGRYVVQATSVLEAASRVRDVGGRILSAIDLIRGVGAVLTGEQAQRLAQMPGVRVTAETALDGGAK